MGEKFFKYKQEIITLRASTEKFLNMTMNDIAQGLPSVTAEENTKKRDVLFDEIAEKSDWQCRICLGKNKKGVKTCTTCGGERFAN